MFCLTPHPKEEAIGPRLGQIIGTGGPVIVGKVARTNSLAVLRGHKHVRGGRGGYEKLRYSVTNSFDVN